MMMAKITNLFLVIFVALYFASVGVKLILHGDVPDVVFGLLAWGIVAMLILHAKFLFPPQK